MSSMIASPRVHGLFVRMFPLWIALAFLAGAAPSASALTQAEAYQRAQGSNVDSILSGIKRDFAIEDALQRRVRLACLNIYAAHR